MKSSFLFQHSFHSLLTFDNLKRTNLHELVEDNCSNKKKVKKMDFNKGTRNLQQTTRAY